MLTYCAMLIGIDVGWLLLILEAVLTKLVLEKHLIH
jgi:hypothetical protein